MSGSRQLRLCGRRNPSTLAASTGITVIGVLHVGAPTSSLLFGRLGYVWDGFMAFYRLRPSRTRLAVLLTFLLGEIQTQGMQTASVPRVIILQIATRSTTKTSFFLNRGNETLVNA